MKSWEQCKQEVADDHGFPSFTALYYAHVHLVDSFYQRVAEKIVQGIDAELENLPYDVGSEIFEATNKAVNAINT